MIPRVHVYTGTGMDTLTTSVQCDGEPFRWERSLQWEDHSPTGLAWGYLGSGPAQLALAILLNEGLPPYAALRYYQSFKKEVIQHLEEEWTITSKIVHEWLASYVYGTADEDSDY